MMGLNKISTILSNRAVTYCLPIDGCVHLVNSHPAIKKLILHDSLPKLKNAIYCKSFKVEKFCGFRRSIVKRKTFTVKYFCLVLKMVGHSPGSSLKEFCDFPNNV